MGCGATEATVLEWIETLGFFENFLYFGPIGPCNVGLEILSCVLGLNWADGIG